MFLIGAVVGLAGGFIAGDMSDTPIKLKIGISLGMIGVSIIGFAAGVPNDKTKKQETTNSS